MEPRESLEGPISKLTSIQGRGHSSERVDWHDAKLSGNASQHGASGLASMEQEALADAQLEVTQLDLYENVGSLFHCHDTSLGMYLREYPVASSWS